MALLLDGARSGLHHPPAAVTASRSRSLSGRTIPEDARIAGRVHAHHHALSWTVRFDSGGHPAYAVLAGHFPDEVDACDSDG